MKQEILYAGYTLKGKALIIINLPALALQFYAANRNSAYRNRFSRTNISYARFVKENYYEAAMITLVALDVLYKQTSSNIKLSEVLVIVIKKILILLFLLNGASSHSTRMKHASNDETAGLSLFPV